MSAVGLFATIGTGVGIAVAVLIHKAFPGLDLLLPGAVVVMGFIGGWLVDASIDRDKRR